MNLCCLFFLLMIVYYYESYIIFYFVQELHFWFVYLIMIWVCCLLYFNLWLFVDEFIGLLMLLLIILFVFSFRFYLGSIVYYVSLFLWISLYDCLFLFVTTDLLFQVYCYSVLVSVCLLSTKFIYLTLVVAVIFIMCLFFNRLLFLCFNYVQRCLYYLLVYDLYF